MKSIASITPWQLFARDAEAPDLAQADTDEDGVELALQLGELSRRRRRARRA